jgi:hypothetical protein
MEPIVTISSRLSVRSTKQFPKLVRRQGGKPCHDPVIWCTNVQSPNIPFTFVNEATDSAPQAKIAQNGKIIRWPSFSTDWIAPEDPKKKDGTLKDCAPLYRPTKK